MKYSELVNSGATEIELQEQLVGGDMTTITMHVPRNLKEAGAEAAALSSEGAVRSRRISTTDA